MPARAKTMTAAVISRPSWAPTPAEWARPVPEGREVLVTVHAAGIHPIVRALATRAHYASAGDYPRVIGIDGVGHLDDGRRVYFLARPPQGTVAQSVAVLEAQTCPVPDGLDDDVAAAIVNPGMSGWLGLRRAGFEAGETVLVLGAAGVAGRLAIQVAKSLGARRVVAAAREVDRIAGLRTLGADGLIDLEQDPDVVIGAYADEAARQPFDVVLDYLWGRPARVLIDAIRSGRVVRPGTRLRYVQIGDAAGSTMDLPTDVLRGFDVELRGSGVGTQPPDVVMTAVREVLAAAGRGELVTEPDSVPLAEVATAWARGDQAGRRIVIQIPNFEPEPKPTRDAGGR